MLVTPFKRKSNSPMPYPADSRKGTMKEPLSRKCQKVLSTSFDQYYRQQSTCSGILYLTASAESSGMGSTIPSGKFGAEPTSYRWRQLDLPLFCDPALTRIVLALIARFTLFKSAFRLISSTGIWWILIPKYCPALSKAACAEIGITLR